MEQTLDRRISFRPLALPFEHGAWGFLLEPIVLGLLVAPSFGGLLIGIAVIAAFLTRHPLRLALQDRLRGARYPRTAICEAFALGYASVALLAFAGALALIDWKQLWPLLAALPLALVQFTLDLRRHGRTLAAEILGAVAAGATASAIAPAYPLLWLLVTARAIPSILYVRSVLGREGRAVMLVSHVAAVVIAALVADWPAIAAMLILLIRALPRLEQVRARDVGIREIVFGVVAVGLIAAGVG